MSGVTAIESRWATIPLQRRVVGRLHQLHLCVSCLRPMKHFEMEFLYSDLEEKDTIIFTPDTLKL